MAGNSKQDFQFTSKDGLQIACSRWESCGPARGIVQIAHGMGEHMGRYSELITVLREASFIVYANDHRGHGRTAVKREQLGDFGAGGFDLLVQDIRELSLIARKEHPQKPLILLGHSMGSFAAQQYILEYSYGIDGMVLSGSGALDGLAAALAASAAPERFLNACFEPARTPFDWLSRDTRVVDAFIHDPLCFPNLKPASLDSFLCAGPRLADPKALSGIRQDLPIYLFSGSEDPVGLQLDGVRTLIERYKKAGVRRISHDFYAGGRHEMLNEVNRGEVRTNLLLRLAGVLGEQSQPREALCLR